jgi:hypothetical protein
MRELEPAMNVLGQLGAGDGSTGNAGRGGRRTRIDRQARDRLEGGTRQATIRGE